MFINKYYMSWLLNWLLYELAIKLTINDLKLSVGYTIKLART